MATQTEPTGTLKRSWKDTFKRSAKAFSEKNLGDLAAALTYYSMLSLFPALLALVSLIGLFGDTGSVDTFTSIVGGFAPDAVVSTVRDSVAHLVQSRGGAGITLAIGIAGALWSASGYVGGFMRAGNAIYDVDEGRSFLKRRPLQVLITLVMVVVFGAVGLMLAGTGSVANSVGDALGVGDAAVLAYQIAKWPILVILTGLLFSFLYYTAPNVEHRRFRWVTPGGLLAVVIWLLASIGFAIYTSYLGSYNATYGTFATVIVLLLWLWISNLALLLGLTFDRELERAAGHALPPKEPATES